MRPNNISLEWHTLRAEKMGIIVSRQHRFAEKRIVKMSDLVDERFVINKSEIDAKFVQEICFKYGVFTPNIVCESTDDYLTGHLVEANYGISFVDYSQFISGNTLDDDFFEPRTPVCVCILEEDITLETGVISRKGEMDSPVYGKYFSEIQKRINIWDQNSNECIENFKKRYLEH